MKIQVITMSLLLFVTNSFAQGNRFECDESCDPTSSGVAKFNVVSPVGLSTMEQIEMAPRLETLEGKTNAIVG